jgi:hypothetical protein
MEPIPLNFRPGIYGNRSGRASMGRFVDGNLVRFRDDVPGQVGGWLTSPSFGGPVAGLARDIISWRPNNQTARYFAIGTHSNAYQGDGGSITDITPIPFTTGRADSILGAGFGTGLYGTETYGTPRTGGSAVLDASTWTFDMFGEICMGMFSGDGNLYEHLPGSTARFTLTTGAPTGRAMCVSDERHVFVFGTNGQPNRVDWSDREDRNDWTPSAVNRAGFYELQATSPFQCGKRCRGQVLAWTKTEVFGFAPLSNSLVYSRDRLSTACGVMGPHAVVVVTTDNGDVAFWMGQNNFFVYDGLVRTLPCDLYDYIFKDINILQSAKVYAASNEEFGEIWFFYVSAAATEIDRAVIFNYGNATWSKAGIARTVWMDKGIFDRPIAVNPTGTIFHHESGDTDNGAPMASFVKSAPIDSKSAAFLDIGAFWPDMEPGGARAAVSIIGRAYPGAPDEVYGPYEFVAGTEKVDLTISVRQFAVQIGGGWGHWEIGAPMIEMQTGGER